MYLHVASPDWSRRGKRNLCYKRRMMGSRTQGHDLKRFCPSQANPVCLLSARLSHMPWNVPSGDHAGWHCPISRRRAYPVGMRCAAHWNCRKDKPALWTPNRLTWVLTPIPPHPTQPHPTRTHRVKGRHVTRPWCVLSALMRPCGGFVLFSAHCWVAL